MRRIRTRIFFQILIPVLAVYLVIMLGGIQYMGNSFRDSELARKKTALSNIVRGIDNWLLFRISETVQLSRIPLFGAGDMAEAHSYMTEWRETFAFNYDYLYLIEPSGVYWATDGRKGILMDTAFVNKFLEEGALFVYADPHRYGSIFAGHFVVGVPVYDADGEIARILAATITRETLQKVFGFYAFEDFDSWMMVNPRSIIITHQDPSLSGESEQGIYGRTFLEDGRWDSDEVFVRIMRNGWKVVAFLDAGRIMAPFSQAYALITGFSVFLFLVILAVVLILSTAVARPIRRLNEGVHRIMAGDYGQRVEVNTRDELADLADSFNRLSSRMITRRTDDRFAFLGHIAARMAHELRKPLHVIQLASQSLDDGGKGRYPEIIEQEVANADRFIGEILNFADDDGLAKELYSLPALTDMTVEKYRLLTDPHGVAITFSAEGAIPPIFIDVIRMEEVISNLLQNALNAIAEAELVTEEKRIDVDMKITQDREILLTVRDTGPGFDETVIDRLFDPYFTTRRDGTGLGLSLSYRVLMAHGARITLENDSVGHGLVTVVFPV